MIRWVGQKRSKSWWRNTWMPPNENDRKFPRPIQAEWKRFWAWKISGHSVIFEGFLSEFWRTKPTNSTLLNVSASFDSLGAPGGIQVVEWYVIYMLNLPQCVAVLWLVDSCYSVFVIEIHIFRFDRLALVDLLEVQFHTSLAYSRPYFELLPHGKVLLQHWTNKVPSHSLILRFLQQW